MIRRILDFEHMLLKFLLLLMKFNVFHLYGLDFLHVFLKVSVEPFNVVSSFFIHLFRLLNLRIVVLNDRLHSLFCVPDVLLHSLASVHNLLFTVFGVIDLSFVLSFLDFVLRLGFFEGSEKFLGDLCNLSLSIVGELMLLLDG